MDEPREQQIYHQIKEKLAADNEFLRRQKAILTEEDYKEIIRNVQKILREPVPENRIKIIRTRDIKETQSYVEIARWKKENSIVEYSTFIFICLPTLVPRNLKLKLPHTNLHIL